MCTAMTLVRPTANGSSTYSNYSLNKPQLIDLSSTKQAHDMFDSDWVQALADQTSKAMTSRLDWLGIASHPHQEPIRLLDYACGRGLISKVCSILPSPRKLKLSRSDALRIRG